MVEERPDLEVQRNTLITQSVENARRLLAVEDRILEVLLSNHSSTYCHQKPEVHPSSHCLLLGTVQCHDLIRRSVCQCC